MGKMSVKIVSGLCTAVLLMLSGLSAAGAADHPAKPEQAAVRAAVPTQAMDRVRLQWPMVPGAVKYRLVVLRSAEDTLNNIQLSVGDAYINGYELDTSSWGVAKTGYYWKVCPLDYDGRSIGPYTKPQPLSSGTINPQAPQPTTEFDKMAYAPLYPVYSWIPVQGAASYDVEVYRQKKLAAGADQLIRSLTTDTASLYDDAGYTWAGIYYWRVRARAADGSIMGSWSAPSGFEVTAPVKVAALGDSITHGGGAVSVPPGCLMYDWESYSQVPVKNLGYSGNTVEDMDERFERDVLPFSPKVLVIMGGVNNYRQGDSAWHIIHMLAVMRDKCNAYGIIPVFATVTPIQPERMAQLDTIEAPAEGWLLQQQRLNEWLRSQPYAVDITPALTNNEGCLRAELTTDGLHPDQQGKRIIGETISRYLLQKFPYMDLLPAGQGKSTAK